MNIQEADGSPAMLIQNDLHSPGLKTIVQETVGGGTEKKAQERPTMQGR